MSKWLNIAMTAALIGVLAAPAVAADDAAADDLTAARDLYAAAAYEDALQVLNRLRTADHRPEDARVIEQYRAFCLLALGRSSDAEQAIAAVVVAEPSYQPSADVSPRVRSAFSEVRRKMLPGIIQDKYTAAKMAFDQKNFMAAATGFQQVLDGLKDPDLEAAASQPPLSDLKTLAAGFHDLAASASAPPPSPPAPAVRAVPTPAAPPAPVFYTADDAGVMPPVIIRQSLPPFPANVTVAQSGMLEVLIDEKGNVVAVSMRVSVSPRYDRLAVDAARLWKYRPATLNGTPVKFRKVVQIAVKR
jgi:outer membrane biosynthesis protein TonB